ncbi:tripartite motif-containing protein 3-like [Halichondria panicea]|uniref:tripartite motif-containing protein 3-like n=1 Tax=Halichondria panicea TaxID=6063 RepID=UPI00312B668A
MAATVPSPDLQLDLPVSVSQQKVYRELICSVCNGFLQDPRMLLCAHSFCANCLLPAEDAMCNPLKLGCPICFQITKIQDVNDLLVPSKFAEVIETLTQEDKEHTINNLKQHKANLVSFEEDPSLLLTSQCPDHDQPLDYYCDDCGLVVCYGCTEEEHMSHSCGKSVKFLLEDLAHLESLIQPAHQFAARAEKAVEQLSQDQEAIEANQNICTDTVREVFNQLRRAVDQREKAILGTIEKYAETKLAQVQKYSKWLSEKQERIQRALATALELVDEIYTVRIITEKEELTDELDQQEQGILDIEEALFASKFSSTYVGFKNDSTVKIQKEVNELISLCEFYPDADSGYYLSRPIQVENEEDPYLVAGEAQKKAKLILQPKKSPLKYSKSFQDTRPCVMNVRIESIKELTEESEEDDDLPPQHALLGRRHSTPGGLNRTTNHLPLVPIRFDSLNVQTPIVQPTKVFNKLSRSKTEIVNPCGICIGENNSIVLSDVKNHCLRIIASNGKFIDSIGKEGKISCEFEEPCAIAVDKNMHLLVLQRDNPRVQKLTSSGKYLSKFGQKSLRGSSLGEPWGIAVGPNKKIYISDWDRNAIHIFNSNGKYDKTLNEETMDMLGDLLKLPAGIAVDQDGSLLVADRGSHCVWRLDPKGSILLKIGSEGVGPGELYLPYGVVVCTDGSIAVSESGNNRVSIFSPSGTFLKHFGQKGNEPGMFNHPRHMCITKENELVVADELNGRLQLFSL